MIIYRKVGVTARFEWRRSGTASAAATEAIIVTRESGEYDEGSRSSRSSVRTVQSDKVAELHDSVADAAAALGERHDLEQILLTSGFAEHEYAQSRWSESSAQALAIVIDEVRHRSYVIHSGSVALSGELTSVRSAIALPNHAPGEVRVLSIAPHAAAAVIRAAAQLSRTTDLHPLRFRQDAPSVGDRDGVGALIDASFLTRAGLLDPPNLYRPSYRFAPIRHLLHLRLDAAPTTEPADASVVALTKSPWVDHGSIYLEALVRSAASAHLATIALTREQVPLIRTTGSENAVWYPAEGGTWGETLIAPDFRLQWVKGD